MRIHDMADDPAYNPATDRGRGTWALRNVSESTVYLDAVWAKPTCTTHGAMNAVAPTRNIWRCLMCTRACYATDL